MKHAVCVRLLTNALRVSMQGVGTSTEFGLSGAERADFLSQKSAFAYGPGGDRRLLVLLGKEAETTPSTLRKATAKAITHLRATKTATAMFELPSLKTVGDEASFKAIAQSAVLANYSFPKYKTTKSRLDIIILEKAPDPHRPWRPCTLVLFMVDVDVLSV